MGDDNVSRRYNASEEEISRDYQKCAGGGLPHVAVLVRGGWNGGGKEKPRYCDRVITRVAC